jgi:NADH dehydrogenase
VIVVAGGSGTLGRLVVANLLDRGEPVRVLVRDAARGRAVLGADVDVVAGDIRQTAGLDQVVAGASALVLAVHGFLGGRGAGPAEVDDRGNANLIDAAAKADADVVLVSVLGAAQNSPVDFFRAKHAAEQNVRLGRTPWTIVRAGPFLETWLAVLATTAGTSGRPLVFGRGDQPLPFVSALDVAAVVARSATDTTLRGSVLEIAGEPIAMTDLARALQQSRQWRGSPRHVPRAVLRALAVLARPLNPGFARQNRTALAMDTGQVAVPAAAANPLGPPPRTVADVVAGSVLK